MKRYALLTGAVLVLAALACSVGPQPTATPEPTATPKPTNTPVPTNTPTPEPTPTTDPMVILAPAIDDLYTSHNEDAMSKVQDILDSDPNNADALAIRAMLKLRDGDSSGAEDDLNEAQSINPDSVWVHVGLSWLAGWNGDDSTASDEADAALAIDPNNALAYGMKASVALDMGNDQDTLNNLNQAIELQDNYFAAYINRGWYYIDNNRLSQAMDDFNQAIDINPDHPDGYSGRGRVAEYQGDINSAFDDYDTAVQLAPDSAYAYWDRGYMHFLRAEDQQALNDYNTAIRLGLDNPYIYSDLGLVNEYLGNYDDAVTAYRSWLAADPSNTDAQNALAYALTLYGGDPSEARNLIEQALSVEPNNTSYLDTKALVLLAQGDTQTALTMFQALVDGGVSYSNFGLGLTYDLMGNTQEAIAAYQAFLADYPDDVNSSLAQQRLDALTSP